jgi:predicted nucleic acid-binding protein
MTAKYLIDSDICIYAMSRLRGPNAQRLLGRLRGDGLAISVITYGEVLEGVLGSKRRGVNTQLWRDLVAAFDVVGITTDIAEIWAEMRLDLRRRGRMIADADMLIGSTALRFGMTLVTNNVAHFGRIDGLEIFDLETVSAG